LIFPGIYAPEPQMAKNTGGKPCLQSLKKHGISRRFFWKKPSRKYFSKEKGRKIWWFEIILLLLHRISQKAAHG
jgi:hypothetical protein